MTDNQRLVDETVAVPALLGISWFRQRDGLADETAQGIRLRQRLPVELTNPLRRTVGGNDNQGPMLIVSLSDGWSKVEKRCA